MASHNEWKPHSRSYQEVEESLQAAVDRDVILQRNIAVAQARGQFDKDPRTATIKALQQQQDYKGVLDIDQYAQALMNELGVTEAGAMDHFGSKLASATTKRKRPGFIGPEQLAKNWKIGLEAAKRTVEATTQLAVRDFSTTTGGRRLKPHHWMVDQKRISCPVYHDTIFAKCKSLRGNTCAEVYATAFQYQKVISLPKKADAHYSLDDFFNKVGIPSVLISDNAPELTEGDFRRKAKRAQCPMKQVEVET